MASGKRVLTVTYGTFSCTLEGFDDAFVTMKAITEYFRDLAAEDRKFGVELPKPSTETLKRIAERELSQGVDARVEETGLVLRPAERIRGDGARDISSGKREAPPLPAGEASDEAPRAKEKPPEPEVKAVAPGAEAPAQEDETAAPEADSAEAGTGPATAPAPQEQRKPGSQSAQTGAPGTGQRKSLDGLRAKASGGNISAKFQARSAEVLARAAEKKAQSEQTESVADKLSRIRSAVAHAPQGVVPDADSPNGEEDAVSVPFSSVRHKDEPKAEAVPDEAFVLTPAARKDDPADQVKPAPLRLDATVKVDAAPEPADAPAPLKLEPQARVETPAEVAAPDETVAAEESAPVAPTEAPDDLETDDTREFSEPEEQPTAPAKEVVAEEEMPQASPAKPRKGQSLLATAGDESVERLVETTNSQLKGAENRRRHSAIAHLKAAVAATTADREAGVEDDDGAEQMNSYRDALSQIVQPGGGDKTATEARQPEPVAPAPMAPLVLVSSQRIRDPQHAGAYVPDDFMGRPTKEVAGDGPSPTKPSISFEDFASSSDAENLVDLMEVASAYLSIHEGRGEFSRQLVMDTLAKISDDGEIPREEGLAAFGTLLRQGRLVKGRRGLFSLPQSSRYAQGGR